MHGVIQKVRTLTFGQIYNRKNRSAASSWYRCQNLRCAKYDKRELRFSL